MELYLSACSKTASVAANKAASSTVAEDSQQCGDGTHKTPIPGVGAAQLLDLPLGVKLPMIPGTDTVYFTTNISEKLFRPSYGFNLSDPYCRLLETQYKSLHDPHLRTYYKRKDILRRLKKGGYITSNNKIVCSLRELNKYRQYLTSLKLDFERNYLREQQLISKQLHKLQETSQLPHCSDVTRFQNWLLQDNTQSIKDQERLLRHRYLDMISKELDQLERTAEEQRLLRMDREERRQREYARKKLSLRRKIEEEWKTKEMMLLTKIGEDVKREQRIEEQRRKSREESDRKKQAMLEKKMAYHLQKMQDTGLKDDMGRSGFEYKGQNGTMFESSSKKKKKQFDDIKIVYPDGEPKAYKGTSGQVSASVNQSQSSSKNVTKMSGSSVAYQADVQNSSSEHKRNEITKNLSDERGKIMNSTVVSARESIISAQQSPTKNARLSQTSLVHQKEEKEMQGDWNARPSKKSSYVGEPGSQAGAPPPGIFSSPVYSNMQQNLQHCLKDKVTSEELNGIIQNIMTWVVATVTSILYPAITKYEERVQSNIYPVSDDSDLSSDSSSFCSTCSEGFTYRRYTAKTFQADPCTFASDMPMKKPPTPLKPPSAHVERTVIGQTYQKKGKSVSSQVNYNKTSMDYPFPKIGSSKSDSHILTSLETSTKKSKDATTETESLEIPLLYDKKAKAMDQIKNLKNVFVNFKCHLKGETQLILESIFQEIMSDLSQAIPSLSSVTAEVFVDQTETEREELLSNVDICSVASEIVENMLEKLESAVEKKCVQIFSQEDLSVDIKPSLSTSGEYFSSIETKPSEDTLSCTLEPMCDIADDMVHAILEKLMILASYKKNEVPPEDTSKPKHFQQPKTEPIHRVHQQTDQKKASPVSDPANLLVKEEIQSLIANIFSQSSLVGYVEEAISTILGYVQTELNNERLIASEETVVLLQLLDDVLTQLHQQPVKAGAKKPRRPRVRNISDPEEKYRLTSTRSFNSLKSKRPFPPVNVPGMVLYSEDDDEEIDNFVQSVLDSSFNDEKAKSQEQVPNYWPKKRDTCFEYKRSNKIPTKSTFQNKVGSRDWGLKLELSLSSEDIVKTKHCLNSEASIFSQDQKHQIQKASESIVKHILTEMLKDMSSDSSSHFGSQTSKETSAFLSEKSQGLSDQEWMEQMFSGSEICAFAHEITDSVINILHKASTYIPNTIKNAFTSAHHTRVDPSDTAHTSKETSSKMPFKVWFDSEKKMKYLSSLNMEHEKTSQLRSGKCEPKRVNDITDKIINTIFKRLKLFVCPKLQIGSKSSLIEKSLHSQLSTYTMKIVNIVLHAIQSELEINKINPNLKEADRPKYHKNKGLFTDSNKVVESHVTSVNDDIMESPLLTCICEMISNTNEDKKNPPTCTDKAVSTPICGSGNVQKQKSLSNKQDKNSFRQLLAKPCLEHSFADEKDLKDSSKLEVLDQIGDTLHEMLSKLTGDQPDCQPSCSHQNPETLDKDPPELSNTQLLSKAILDYVLAKLCDVDTDTSIINSGLKTVSDSLDIDNLSFASTMEEMAKCTNIISNIISKIMKDNNEVTKSKAKDDLPMCSKTEIPEEMCPQKLKTIASDILNMVFAKLEHFASGSVENVGIVNDENKNEHTVDWECESNSSPGDSHDKSLQSTLYSHAKKVSNGILKAIQTELNMSPPDCSTDKKSSPEETQMLTNIVDLILDIVSSDMFDEPDSENQGNENYGYRPTYGNFLPGGAESDAFLDDDTQNKEQNGDTSFSEETRTLSTDQMVLERTLSKIEVKLKEPQRSPIVPIIRNILNEIFQSALISQLNMVSLSHTHFSGMPHNAPVSSTQTSAHSMDQMMGPLVSDTDVSVVVNDVVRTVFHKLYSAAMTEKNVSENRCKTIIFSANVSFRERTYGGNAPVSGLNGNACDLQSSWNVDKQTKINVVEDIVQAILENLETFAASKVESLFCPQVNFTVPVTLPVQQEGVSLSQALTGKDSYSDNQLPCSSVDHGNPEQMDSWCQMSLSKLNIYAKEVARKILQGIKHELDKEQESPLLTNNIVVSENIASQVVNTVLDIVSCKSKCDKNSSDKENYSDQQVGIIERLVNKTEYRKILEFQIQDTIEGILCDIYENIVYQNNLSFAIPTLKYDKPAKPSEANFEPVDMGTNIIPKVSVPKADVILVSKDIVDIVLHNLTSLVMLAINAKDSAPATLAIYEIFPKPQCQQPLTITQRTEEKPGHFSLLKNKNLGYPDVYQMPVNGKEDPKEPAPNPCEENANCITETIFNRLQSFATERINSLMTLTFQSKGNVFVSPQFENGKDDNCILREPGQAESDVNVLKLSTSRTVPSQELAEPMFASCRENFVTTPHLSQTSLKDYSAFIASTILKLIKNDLDLEIQSMHTYSNHILFEKNMIVSEIVNSILKILHNTESVKEYFLASPETSSCSQLTISNDVLLGYKEKEKATALPQFTNDSLEENQITVEKECQRDVLEEIFMRKGESKPKEKTEILRTVEEVLRKLSQKIMDIIGHIAPFNEIPYVVSKSKSKTTATTQKKLFQSHINNVANDILENVLGEIHSVVVTSLYKKSKNRREGEMCESSDGSLVKPPGFRETKPMRKRSSPLRLGVPQMHPYADNLNALVLENTFLPYSPLQIGKYLVQIVLDKLSNFVSLHLEEGYPPEGSYDDLYLLRLHNSKLSPKNSPRPGCKTSLKMRSKITSLSKFKTKPHLGISGTKTKSKTKLSAGEKTPRENRSKTALGLPQTTQAEDAKTTLKTKLPVAELRIYATNIITDILEVIMRGLERAAQHRAMFHTKVLASSQILEASKIVNAVLQELYAANNDNLASPNNISNLSEHRLSKQNLGAGYSTEQPCFYLENVSSQLEQIFPKEGILKKMFDKWQTETSDTETEKSKLLTIAENILTEISIKAKDLEYSLSLLNLPPLEECENRFYDRFKGVPTRAEDTKAQINMFGREIVEMLFEKLQLCFLSQMPTQDSNGILTSRKEHVSAKSKYGVPTKHILSGMQTCSMKTKDQVSMSPSNQIVHEIVERVLNMLESFVDLKFKHISKYEFSEIVKMPIDNLFQVQQRQLSKKMLPKLPFRKPGDESKSSTIISKENAQNTLLQVHLFHSELLTYSVTAVSGMLRIIKNKLDKEISQMEPSPVSILKENIAASEIIGTLIDQCSHFGESLIKNLPTKNWFQGTENVYIVNQVEFAPPVKMPPSNVSDTTGRINSPQRSVSGLGTPTEDDTKEKYGIASNVTSHISSSVENTSKKSSEPMGRPNSKAMCSRHKTQDLSWRNPNFAPFEEVAKAHSFLPEGSMLQKLFKKVNDSTEESRKQVLSFIEMGKGENPRVFHYEATKSAEANEIKTTASPLKICLAAENIVNTVLSSYGFPHQPNISESTETMKPFFMSRQNPLSEVCEGQKDTEKTLLRTWCSRTTLMQEDESGGLEASQEDFSLLYKWKNKNPKTTAETMEETDTIAFSDHELGPNEMHLVARHVTTSVITHLKNFKTAVSTEKFSHISSLSKKNDDAKQSLKSIYSNSSVYQFCEHLSEAVIFYLISNISDGTNEFSKEKAWEIQDAMFDKNILIHSQLYKTRSISIGDLALSIFEVIVEVLSNGNMINADKVHQASIKAKYMFCPGVTSSDFDDIFQDLLKGVISVLSKVLGINHCENNVRNKSYPTLNNSLPIFNKVNTMENQIGRRELESSHLTDHLAQKNKLNYLARRLNSLVGSLRSHESKEVVNEVFNIVLDLFLPDELPDGDMSSGKLAKTCSSSNNQPSNRPLTNNLGLSSKSIFLLNIVCEKLIRTLLEKCTGGTAFFEDRSHFHELPEECQHVKVLPSFQGGGFDYRKAPMDCEQFQGDYMSDLLENLADIDQDLLSSDCILNVISHSLVKSLMDKLSHGLQQAPFENKYRNYRTREIQPFISKAKRQELIEPEQTKSHVGFMTYDNSFLTKSLNNANATNFKMHTRFGKQHAGKSVSLSFPDRKESRGINTVSFHKLCQRGVNGGVFSATFLEEIISELFFNLSTSLWRKNLNITEVWLNEINTLLINNVVKNLNNAQITVLRYPEERLYFPSAHKGCITKIVDSIYYDVLQQYEFTVTCGGNLPHDNTPVAERISNSILLEIIDYQLPSCFKGKLRSNLYHALNAEIILYKLQNSLKKCNSEPTSSKGYSTMLPHSFLEYVIRRLLAQLIPLPTKSSSLEKKYLSTSDFNEMSNCITNKVMSAISKHKIWFTIYDNQCLHTDKNLQKMVNSVYSNILQMSDSLDLIQKNILSRSPIMIDQIASFIIQEIIENHLQPFLCGETLPRPKTPLDEVSYMVKQVLNEVVESHKSQKPSPFGIYPDKFVGEIVTRVLARIFSPKPNTNLELENMTQKIVNSVNNHLEKAKIPILSEKQSSFPFSETHIVDELATSVYKNVLKQHRVDPDIDESENSEVFMENITKLITAAISDYLLHPLFSGDLPAAYSNSMSDHSVYDMLGDINKSSKPNQTLPLYNTLLPYTFLEDMIKGLLSKFFPSSPKIDSYKAALKDKEGVNFNEIASNLISDIRRKISQHEIRFSKDEEKTKPLYSENDIQNLVDVVFANILENSGSPESVEQNITKSNDVFIDQIAGFIIKYICEHHLQPFVERKQLSTASYKYFDDDRQELFYGSAYSSTFLEDVVSGVVSKIFHRVVGIVQVDSTRNTENVLFDKAETLIYWITEEFSKAHVTTIENAEERLCLSPVEGDTVKNIIDTVSSHVLEEHEMEIMRDKDFLNDTKALAAQITKIILIEISYFQIPPDLVANLPLRLHSKLSQNVLVNRVHYDISKSRFRRQASTMYNTMLSHVNLEKLVTQLMSQLNPSDSSVEHSDTYQSDLNNTVIKLIDEIMSIISKHAICIVKHGNEKQSMISEKDIQSMVDSIYADLSHSNLYQSLTKDKKGISSIPVSKIASFIIKEIFNHHLESFLSGDKSILSTSVAQTCKKKTTTNTKQRELSFIVNSAVFLEEVITELLCKILQTFIQNSLSTETPERAIAKIMDIVTTLVKSIVFEFTTSEILVSEHLDESLWFSDTYKEMVQKTVNSVYRNLFDECQSLTQLHRALQNDTSCFGGKIYHFLLEEMYDYQVQSLVSGELMPSCYSSPQAANIIKNVLNVILKDTNALPSCITVLPCSLIENMIYKLLENIFPSDDTEKELKKEEAGPDDVDEFLAAASKLTDEIIQEISEHEIRFANAEDTASLIYETTENFIDSVCNNILKKSEFQAEAKKDAHKKGGSFLSKIAGSIIKEIMDHHLQLFLYGEDSASSNLPHAGGTSVVAKSGKEKAPSSLFSAAFLEDVIVDLAHKFCSFLTLTDDARKKDMPEAEIVSSAIKFANSLIRDFRKSGIKVLPHAEEIFSFPPIAKETIDEISNFVYDQFIGKFGADGIQKDGTGNIVIEMVSSLAQKAISTFKIQPLFSGDWCSTFFSFLDPENISQRVQLLPKKTSIQISGSLKQNQLALSKDTSVKKDDTQDPILNSIATIMKSNIINLLSGPSAGVTDAKKEDESKVKPATQETTSPPPKSPPTSMKSKDIQVQYSAPSPPTSMKSIGSQVQPSAPSSPPSMKGRGTQVQQSPKSPPTSMKSRGSQVQPSAPSPPTSMESRGTQMQQSVKSPPTSMKGSGTQMQHAATSPPTSMKSQGTQSQQSAKSPPTSMKGRGTQVHKLSDKRKSNETGKENLVLVNEQGQVLEIFTHFAVATTTENSTEKEKIDVTKSSVKTGDKPKSKNKETMTEKNVLIPQQPVKEERRQSVAETDTEDISYSETECVENVIENIYDNVFIVSSQEPLDFSRPIYSRSLISDKALVIVKDSSQLVTAKNVSSSVHKDIPAKEKTSEGTQTKGSREESETKRSKEMRSKSSMTDHPRSSSDSKPKIVPAKFLEDVITELVNKLVFTSLPETEKSDKSTDTNDQKSDELYDTAMRLVDSMMKEFSNAEVKVFRPDKENEVVSQAVKESAQTAPPESKETTTKEPSSSTNIKNEDKMSHVQKTPEQSFSDKLPSAEKIPSIEKSIVNKIVHSCVCNVLKECKSQESICENINSNGENLAKRLTGTVISEIFQHQLNLIFSDEVPASACVPLESKDVEEKVQNAVQTTSKECQTASPYTIQLPYKFLEDVTSGLFAKVFSKWSNVKTKLTPENVLTQLDFLQTNLVKTIAAEISKNEDLIIQYVESLHPNDDEIIQLVVQTIYNNLLPQFGSQEILQKCIISGCKLLSKSIVDLVLREVTGNQLQNYFGGELTPYQCAEVDSVVENILTNVVLTTPSQPSSPRKLSYNIIETIAVKFLSKLLSVFPKGHTERTKSQETEMRKITSKILNSIQEFISKSKIKVVQPAKESEAVPSADKATIEKVVNSVYENLLKHSGSPASVCEDLMGKSDVLSDIIGFSMVKEISNSEFQPQAEEELSSSELVLEAVKIMEKVVKIIDELKSQEKPASIKDVMLDSRVLEEALALFLAKLVRTPGAASKDTNSLTKPELNKFASQLTKSVTAEISKSNISLVDSNHEEQSLDPENIEMISQVVESVYSNIIKQSGTQNELYDIKAAKKAFPKKVASLIVDGVSSVPSCRISTESSYTATFGDLDTHRIIEKAQKHAVLMSSDSDKESEDALEDELPVKIIPHVRDKPMKIDPNIISEHLAVISMKTQPLETLKLDCIKRTGCSIAELRRASISGKGPSSTDVSEIGTRQKERRISLDRTGRLDVKPLEAVGRNSFQNVRRPDITRVELLKDINNKKDLIIRLVAHDIGQKDSDSSLREDTISDDEEIVLGEVVGDQCLRKVSGGRVHQVVKSVDSHVVSPKTTTSTSSLKKFLALSKCCQPTSGENIESIESTGTQIMEPSKTYVKRAIAELDMPTSKSLAEATSSRDKLQYKKEEILATEPTHYFIHRIMSTSSYNQEDLLSGEAEEFIPEPKAHALEESCQDPQEGNSNSVEFVTIYEGSKQMASSSRLSKEHVPEVPRSSISKQGSKVLAKVSSTLSKVFSRSSGSIPKSSSPPHQDKN
ncbi:fibrous sheath-interacting protein 2 isoform X1 [Apodemus sylvaticus]|uniref:fibrous sheath-interacting protein 2 isoform X1 n=1 Tax=Apodemus sylvaticus TaxID=10129 RepID=UPI002243A703|nr:fibrous sheath-interacting protein 2 isoform X1 [Apodemus sylvaticus]